MSKLSEKELLSFIKSGNVSSLFLLYGPDEYSKEICLRRIIKAFSPQGEPILFDGQALNMQSLHEECVSVSFFDEDKCVCVRNPAIDSFTAEQGETLYSIISQKPVSTALIFVVKSEEINTKKSAKWAKFIKAIDEKGIVIECSEKSDSDVVSMITNTAKKHGCSIETPLAYDFARRCNNDMLQIENDLVKLCAFASEKCGGVITSDAIENLSARQLDYKTYEITKQIINRKGEAALLILNSLFLQQIDPIAINAALSSAFIDIYRVKMMEKYNHSLSELKDSYDYKGKDYKLRGAGFDAPKCSIAFLKKAINILSDSDVKLKSTKDDKKFIMEKAVVNLLLANSVN